MSTGTSGQRIDTELLDFRALPADCHAAIISLTSPLDACRLSLVSPFFNSLTSSDAVWDLYLSICDHPVLIEDAKKSFSLHKRSGKKCYMLAARDLAIRWGDTHWSWNSVPDSRFPEVAKLLDVCWFEIKGRIAYCVSACRRYWYPIEREDGWLELELGEFFNEGGEDDKLEIRIFHFDGNWKSGVIIEGIEIRPN
ncbi:hypothetical protein SLA2020_033790 [Shorea laevis]